MSSPISAVDRGESRRPSDEDGDAGENQQRTPRRLPRFRSALEPHEYGPPSGEQLRGWYLGSEQLQRRKTERFGRETRREPDDESRAIIPPFLEDPVAAYDELRERLRKAQTLVTVLELLGLDGWFETVVVSHFEGVEKPDAELFRRALDRLGADPGTTLHVGDSPDQCYARLLWHPLSLR